MSGKSRYLAAKGKAHLGDGLVTITDTVVWLNIMIILLNAANAGATSQLQKSILCLAGKSTHFALEKLCPGFGI